MSSATGILESHRPYSVSVGVQPALNERNRLTTAFRVILAIPHLLLVGGPVGVVASWTWWTADNGLVHEWGNAGAFGAVAGVAALIAWFAILFTGHHPEGLRDLQLAYLRWRVRALAYVALLRDEYPPFGDGPYTAVLELVPAREPRDRLTVAFRLVLALPHIVALSILSFAWFLTTVVAWCMIIVSGDYPRSLYTFGVGVLQWNTRVDAYLLLLVDDYPPFSFQ